MLVVQCANGWAGWIFQYIDRARKAATCTDDGFQLVYDPTPSVAWVQMVQQLVAHSVALHGAFVTTHWLQP